MRDEPTWGEHPDSGDEGGVPADLVELYEVLEWENAVAAQYGDALPHPQIGVPPPFDPGVERSTPFVTRAGWGARPPECVSRNISPEGTTLHYGGPSPWGSGVDRMTAVRFLATASHARCATIMRAYQAFHLDSRGWCDFAYSSGVCPHGTRYEGRGPGVRTAAQGTNDGNLRSYACVGLWGDGDPLTDPAKLAYLDEGARLARLRWGHRDWKSTACPGNPAYAWRSAGFPRPATSPPPPEPTPPEEDDMPPPIIARTSDQRAWLIGPHFRTRVQGQTDFNLCKLIHHARVDEDGQAIEGLPDEWILSHVDTATLS
jgi:hypothetical protein